MKIPKRDVVKFVVKSVLHRRGARSQHEFSNTVNAELRKVDSEYSISGARLREIAVHMPDVRVSVSLRKGRIPNKCPSCGSSLKKVFTRNLRGRNVLEGLRCQKCGYRGSGGKWLPGRYAFSRSR